MKKMKKKIKKAVRDKQQQQQRQRERVADDTVDGHTNQFPNYMALTKEEKLVFFESLHAARKSVLESGKKVRERFGTVHDEYLEYFGSVEDNEGSESFNDSSQTLECSGVNDSVSSSLRSSATSSHSGISRRPMTAKPVETICIHMNMSTNSSTPSIMSSKHSLESKSLTSKGDEEREEGGCGSKSTETEQKSPEEKRLRDDDSDRGKMKSSSRFVTKLPKLKRRESQKAQKDERKFETSTSNRFEALESGEKEIFFSTLKETRDDILTESPDRDNSIPSMKDIKYEKPKAATPMKRKVPYRKETYTKNNNLRLKVIITSSESKRIKKERVSKGRKERCRKTERERTKKTTGGSVEKDKTSKTTERKLVRSADGVRKKQQRQNNSIATKSKESKRENVKAQTKGDFEKGCQNKRNKEEGKALVKSERSTMKNRGGKQEKKKTLASRKKTQKDKPKEKREKPKKKGSAKTKQVEEDRQLVLLEEEKEEVAEEVKEDSRSPGDGAAGALERPTETAETEAESVETFFFVNKFKHKDEVEGEGKDKTEDNQPEDSLSLKSFQKEEEGEEVKRTEAESVEDKGVTLSEDTTDEEITIEVEEEISITETPFPVTSEVRYQPEPTGAGFERKSRSKSLTLELKPEGESLDDCYAEEPTSHSPTSDEVSVLQLWEELKRLQLTDSDCLMETESLTSEMGRENIPDSRFTFLSNKTSPNKVHIAELILIESENKIEEGEGGREGVIVVDGDAIEKIKNLVEALEREAEPEGDTKPKVKPDMNNENEHSQLLLDYIDYLTRLLYMLTNKREQKPNTRVHVPLTAAGSHSEFVENKTKKLEFRGKRRAVSDSHLLEERKTEVELKAKESILEDSEVEANSSSSSSSSDSSATKSSSKDDVPVAKTPSERKKLIEDFVRDRAKFVEESIDGSRMVKMASEAQGQETGQNRPRSKFFHTLSRLCKCVGKRGSEEDQVRRRQQLNRREGDDHGAGSMGNSSHRSAIIATFSNTKNFLDTEDP